MRLHGLGITSLRQNLEQITVRQEVETREAATLVLQVLGQAVLDLIKDAVVALEFAEKNLRASTLLYVGNLAHSVHELLPELVDHLELLGLLRQRLLHVLSREDVFEIHPRLLESEPLVDDPADDAELFLPLLDLGSDVDDVLATHAVTNRHLVVLKGLNDLLDLFADDEAVLHATIALDWEVDTGPLFGDLSDRIENVCLTGGSG